MILSNSGRRMRSARLPREARHYHSHLSLLVRTNARINASLDAIIVPASRSAFNLDHAIMLARKLDCHLVVLCSLNAHAKDVNELLALRNFTRAIVVDLPDGYALPKLDLDTAQPFSRNFPVNSINPNGDLSVKRNIGLLLARLLGWRRIFFLDDDIRDLYSSDLREIARMLGPCDAVGMRATDYPDNSVVCHGHRETGERQEIFVSGSVLAVHCTEGMAFFPEIYNEDWFFFYHTAAARRLGWYGRDATQLCYDPFADPQRAAGQEFGDVMAEGLFGLLHSRISAEHANSDYWQTFLDARMKFLEGVLVRSEKMEPFLQQRIANSIQTAMTWNQSIDPQMCEHYIGLWRRDLAIWEQRLSKVPVGVSVKKALGELGLKPSGSSLSKLAGILGTSDTRKADELARSGSDRTGGLARRLLIEARPAPTDVSRNKDSQMSLAGRHRRPLLDLPLDLHSKQAALLAELSSTGLVPHG